MKIYHLLIPKHFRTWCRPDKAPSAKMDFAIKPSKCSCSLCLTRYREWLNGNRKPVKVQELRDANLRP